MRHSGECLAAVLVIGVLTAQAAVTRHFSFRPREVGIGGGASVVVPVPKAVADARVRAAEEASVRDSAVIGRVFRVENAITLWVAPNGGGRYKVLLRELKAYGGGTAAGDAATKALRKLLLGKTVTVKYHQKDRTGALVGCVYLTKEDVNLRMIRDGYAEYAGNVSEHPYLDAQREARLAGRGMWAPSPPVEIFEQPKEKP